MPYERFSIASNFEVNGVDIAFAWLAVTFRTKLYLFCTTARVLKLALSFWSCKLLAQGR